MDEIEVGDRVVLHWQDDHEGIVRLKSERREVLLIEVEDPSKSEPHDVIETKLRIYFPKEGFTLEEGKYYRIYAYTFVQRIFSKGVKEVLCPDCLGTGLASNYKDICMTCKGEGLLRKA